MTTERLEPPNSADETTMLRSFLAYYRATLRRQVEGLTQEQLATPLAPSTMTLGGMLKHLAYVEHWWFSMVLHGAEEASPWAAVDWDADEDWDWHSAKDDTPEQLLDLHAAEVARADASIDAALATGDLDQLAQRPRYDGNRTSLRWILVHMVEEYARHAGHADLLRESIDGSTDL